MERADGVSPRTSIARPAGECTTVPARRRTAASRSLRVQPCAGVKPLLRLIIWSCRIFPRLRMTWD